MKKKVDPVVDEAIETLNMKEGPTRRRLIEGAGLFSATAAASALIAACTSSSSSSASSGSSSSSTGVQATGGVFPKTPSWQFWFVNHADTNQFFTPTKYGYSDAAALLGLPTPQWGGSASSSLSEMISFMNSAVSAKAAGIALAQISETAFTGAVSNAMNAGIPVVTYNADGIYKNGAAVIGSNRLAYVGQALYLSGQVERLPDVGQPVAADDGRAVLVDPVGVVGDHRDARVHGVRHRAGEGGFRDLRERDPGRLGGDRGVHEADHLREARAGRSAPLRGRQAEQRRCVGVPVLCRGEELVRVGVVDEPELP